MAKNTVADWDTAAANNTDVAGINIAGTTGRVNNGDNAMREIMAQVRAGVPYVSGQSTLATPGSSSNGSSPVTFVIRDSSNAGTWDTTKVHLGYDYYSDDASGAGAGVLARHGIRAAINTHAQIEWVLQTAPVTAGTMVDALVFDATDGVLKLPQGKLKFPATASPSSDANTLDDYEEGSFTPTVTASGCTFSWNTITGVYTKIGNLVTGGIYLQLNTSGNTLAANSVTIGNLPFAQNGLFAVAWDIAWGSTTGSFIKLVMQVPTGTTSGLVRGATAATTNAIAAVTADQLFHATNGTVLRINFSYQT